jgi:uncharacterized protein YbcI
MVSSIPTRGQVERSLSQQIQAFYRTQLGHRLSSVDCQIFDQKIAIILENSITQPEQILAESGKEELVEQIRSSLTTAIHEQLRELIEEVVGVVVQDLLSDTTLETERTGMIAVLAEVPQFRESSSRRAAG